MTAERERGKGAVLVGMFDDVACEYPLPPGAPRTGYQTRSTPNPALDMYVIREDGSLVDDRGRRVYFDGTLELFWSNITGAHAGGGYTTLDGEPLETWIFLAVYDKGRLVQISGGREDESPDGVHLNGRGKPA